ncbi:DUF892 family protein [Flavobacterium sp. 83]|uniref:DUF892 family protein n=1 Tax=Flavobacterium sp. 83 TaxID=1131812 RepID=UPI00068B3E01|nr:DUF892 family protein [Flavobacterium sp. 83]
MKSTSATTDKKAALKEGKGNSKKIILEIKEDCRNVFVEELKEIYFSEKALTISIPIMIKKAATEELVDALKVHLQFTQEHIQRLELFFTSIGEENIMKKYEAMYGLIEP